MIQLIKLADLHPHPDNPRLAPRKDVVDQIAAQLNGKLDEAHALIVRPNGAGYQIISGHQRALAATKAGLTEVPCWVREMSDENAYMALALNNTQGELHPLEVGLHALNGPMTVQEYADTTGIHRRTLNDRVLAARVVQMAHVRHEDALDQWQRFVEIHAAAEWAWSALVEAMLEKGWSVEQTRKQAAKFKPAKKGRKIPTWVDLETIAGLILAGRPDPIHAMLAAVDEAEAAIKAAELEADRFLMALADVFCDMHLSTISSIKALVNPILNEQDDLIRMKREAEEAAARELEEIEERAARLRRHVSLEEWQTLDEATRTTLLHINRDTLFGFSGATADTPTFNRQESADIEWAQWSWNPITGCKHDCPYCYAREMAISARYADSYPYAFEPTLRPGHLASPHASKVPAEAQTDVRYRNVFTGSMADMWGRWVPAEWIEAVLVEMAEAGQWNFLTLTKFPGRMAEFKYTDNVWLGTTVDMQSRVAAAEKAFAKVECGGKKWLSIEPMLEPLTFKRLDLFDFIVVGGASPVKAPKRTPEWRPPARWIFDLMAQWQGVKGSLDGFYAKTNLLGSQCREGLLSLGADVLVTQETAELPAELHYAGMKT